jgi:hypothetical protein
LSSFVRFWIILLFYIKWTTIWIDHNLLPLSKINEEWFVASVSGNFFLSACLARSNKTPAWFLH